MPVDPLSAGAVDRTVSQPERLCGPPGGVVGRGPAPMPGRRAHRKRLPCAAMVSQKDRSWVAAFALAVALGEAAALVLRPREGVLEAHDVDPRAHFDGAEM